MTVIHKYKLDSYYYALIEFNNFKIEVKSTEELTDEQWFELAIPYFSETSEIIL